MSHFAVLVIVEARLAERDLEHALEQQLDPYDENKNVPEYKRECGCVGGRARVAARKHAEMVAGTIDSLRERFPLEHPEIVGQDPWSEPVKTAWKDMLKPYEEAEKTAFESHPDKDKPSPACEECKGTGLYATRYNPASKWDWWEIGGRWTGLLDGYDPSEDPNNRESCWLCLGTGKRNDKLGMEAREKDPEYTCNGCEGTGEMLKFATHWKKHPGDIARVQDIIPVKPEQTPFAVVTADGHWHERGKMGWWAMVSNEKDKDDWNAQVNELLKQNAEHVAVVCDCHI